MADDIRKMHWSIRPPVFVIAVVMFIICQNNFEFGFGMVEIASKVELSGECVDYNSNIMADLDVTQSSLGACDARICHKKTSGNYFVDLICHPDTPPLDNGNCQEVSNSGLAFPNCCPTVTCATAAVPTTPDPSGKI
ncbi:uncharacterized protein [Argopecten irradians]|uniref:uncharacterized protein n=1 Tax=Argopecten irradians TaxID=31199 RepID=UPI00371F61EF